MVRVQGSLERRKGIEVQRRGGSSRWAAWNRPRASGKPNLEAETRRGDSHIDLAGSSEKAIAEVHSKSGIGSATITRVGRDWPGAMRIRLHLRGLESFKVGNGKTVVEWSKSSSGKQVSRVSLVKRGGEEEAIEAGNRYHSEVKTVGEDGKVPLR